MEDILLDILKAVSFQAIALKNLKALVLLIPSVFKESEIISFVSRYASFSKS